MGVGRGIWERNLGEGWGEVSGLGSLGRVWNVGEESGGGIWEGDRFGCLWWDLGWGFWVKSWENLGKKKPSARRKFLARIPEMSYKQ